MRRNTRILPCILNPRENGKWNTQEREESGKNMEIRTDNVQGTQNMLRISQNVALGLC